MAETPTPPHPRDGHDAERADDAPPPPPAGRAHQPGAPGPAECKTAAQLWARALDAAAGSVRTQSMLRAATPVSWEGQTLTVELGGPMRAVLQHRAEEIEKLLRGIAGRKITLDIREPEGAGDAERAERPPDATILAMEHPLVKQAMELFGGKVDRAYYKKKP